MCIRDSYIEDEKGNEHEVLHDELSPEMQKKVKDELSNRIEKAAEAAKAYEEADLEKDEKDYKKMGSEDFNLVADNYFEIISPFEGEDLLLGMAKRSYFFREWNLFFRKYPLILTPFLLYPTYEWNRDTQGIEGTKEVLAGMFYAHTMNYMGIPAGVVSANYNDGLPVGVQIISTRFCEDIILNACEEIEKRVGIMAEKLFERG
mgnify:CR=1 FL=1